MEALNDIAAAGGQLDRAQAEFFVKMLAPFAPHIAAELWERLGHPGFIDHVPWPKLDPEMLKRDSFELVIQVNGKLRGRREVPMDAEEAAIAEIARSEAASWLEGKTVVREIYVKQKLYNIVVK
jgi:leucyl-tRNA synthetase